MPAVVRSLASDADLDLALDASHREPIIVFKHSESCGASVFADELLTAGDPAAPVHRLVVQRHRAASNRLARQLGVRHESPQVIIVARGVAVWHTSHAGVTPERVAAAFARATATFSQEPLRI